MDTTKHRCPAHPGWSRGAVGLVGVVLGGGQPPIHATDHPELCLPTKGVDGSISYLGANAAGFSQAHPAVRHQTARSRRGRDARAARTAAETRLSIDLDGSVRFAVPSLRLRRRELWSPRPTATSSACAEALRAVAEAVGGYRRAHPATRASRRPHPHRQNTQAERFLTSHPGVPGPRVLLRPLCLHACTRSQRGRRDSLCPEGAVWRHWVRLPLGHGWSHPATRAARCLRAAGGR